MHATANGPPLAAYLEQFEIPFKEHVRGGSPLGLLLHRPCAPGADRVARRDCGATACSVNARTDFFVFNGISKIRLPRTQRFVCFRQRVGTRPTPPVTGSTQTEAAAPAPFLDE